MFGGEARGGPGVKDFRFREEVLSKLLHPRPGCIIRLAPPPERSQPDVDDLMPELAERRKIGGHGVVVKPKFLARLSQGNTNS